MSLHLSGQIRHSDYSLVGEDSLLAIKRGLANAKWYATPIPKDKMRELLERRDGPAIRDTIIWFALLFGFGIAGYLLWGTAWCIIPFFCYGVIYASSSDSRWHESSHGTAFKTDWMNNALYEIASFMVLRESTVWRWSHTRHHSDTYIVGRDPEIALQRPVLLRSVIAKFFNLQAARSYIKTVSLHCIGRFTPDELTFIPESARDKVVFKARIYALIYLSVFLLALVTRSILPLMFIGLPTFYGAWLTVTYGLTQHVGLAENVLDHRLNTRTVYMNAIHRYLYWNMGYHIEHHMFPLVPYHALPRLHELVKADMPRPCHGLVEAYREIIPNILHMSQDANYFIRRELPAPAPAAEAAPSAIIINGAGRPVVDGWVEVCAGSFLKSNDVLRFDYGGQTYAVYRTADDKLYATEGICTHGNAMLAEGLLQGTLIECPKHNGRFDVRDGSPQRLPVCVAVKTYDVREAGGQILFNLKSAHGAGVAEAAATHTFRVVSNDNVATFIKELVLEPDAGEPPLAYQPGDYLQFDIPAFPERTLQGIDVKPPHMAIWQAQQVFDLPVGNPIAVRRNYSLASNPELERVLRFNVRIATPPRGQAYPAGVGSSYIFGLQPGDKISAVGPFGTFHIRDTAGEMVYLGGGAGMAPLRAHLSYLFETGHTARRVSFWYGARSLQEMFYQDYFTELAARNPNFSFHVALSEPQPGDAWTSYTGFIHEVLQHAYLAQHPDPAQIEYYLCGPLPMIRAAMKMLAGYGVSSDQIISDEF